MHKLHYSTCPYITLQYLHADHTYMTSHDVHYTQYIYTKHQNTYTTLHYSEIHCITLHCIMLDYITYRHTLHARHTYITCIYYIPTHTYSTSPTIIHDINSLHTYTPTIRTRRPYIPYKPSLHYLPDIHYTPYIHPYKHTYLPYHIYITNHTYHRHHTYITYHA